MQLGHGRSAQHHQHTPALTGWTLRFRVEGHAPARASHELKKRTLQSHDPDRRAAVVRLSHAPLAGVAWAASIVSLDSAARVTQRFVTLSGEILAELA